MAVVAKVGGKEIYYTGTFIVPDEESLKLEFEELSLEVKFAKRRAEEKEDVIEGELAGPKSLVLNLRGFDNPLGSAVLEPIKFGTLQNRDIFLSFSVYAIKGTGLTRVVSFMILLGDQEQAAEGEAP